MEWFVDFSGWAVAFFVSAFVCGWVVSQRRDAWLDKPTDRSLHSIPVPRLGGVAIWSGVVAGATIGWATLEPVLNIYCLLAAVLLLLVAIVDDRKALPPVVRLLVQFIAAVLTVFGAKLYVSWDLAIWAWPWIGVLALVWGINLYNFMDGMDGFAGLMAVIGFSGLAVLGFIQGNVPFSFLCGLLVAANAGFLCFNFPPARIFMGDSGSTVTGFAMVAISIMGWKEGIYPFWIPLVIFSPFWVDATATLLKRLFKRERVWLPHRQHFYQKWVLAGYSHTRVTLSYGLAMLLCSASAIVWQVSGDVYNEGAVPAFWVLFYAVVLLYGDRVIDRQQKLAN